MTSNMNKKIAVFRNTKHDFICLMEQKYDDENFTLEDYIRLSEWQDVAFKPLPREALVAVEMAALSDLRARTVSEFSEKLSFIDGRIANLRALTGPVQS